MKILFKTLVVIEVLILFSLPSLMLIGIIISEKFWLALFTLGGWFNMAYVVCAISGVIGVISILLKIIFPKKSVESPLVLWVYLLLGVTAVLMPAYGMWPMFDIYNWAHVLLFIAPLLGVMHLIYLGRHYLFQINANKRPW